MATQTRTRPASERAAAEVRAWRGRLRMNQAQLGEHLGLSQASISDRLLGKSPFTVDELEQLANLFGIPLAELLQPSTSWSTGNLPASAYDLAA